MLVKLEELIKQLGDRYSFIAGTKTTATGADDTAQDTTAADRDSIEYFHFKFMYMKAKTLRKTRMLQTADEVCQSLMDHVREKMPGSEAPKPNAPAVGAITTIEEAKTEEVKADQSTGPKETHEPKAYWKFAVKAAYLKVLLLSGCMEFSKPKRIMHEFAEPVLVMILKKFAPEIFKAEENRDDGIPASLSEKVLPDHYCSF